MFPWGYKTRWHFWIALSNLQLQSIAALDPNGFKGTACYPVIVTEELNRSMNLQHSSPLLYLQTRRPFYQASGNKNGLIRGLCGDCFREWSGRMNVNGDKGSTYPGIFLKLLKIGIKDLRGAGPRPRFEPRNCKIRSRSANSKLRFSAVIGNSNF
jgi:hypothetical protein